MWILHAENVRYSRKALRGALSLLVKILGVKRDSYTDTLRGAQLDIIERPEPINLSKAAQGFGVPFRLGCC